MVSWEDIAVAIGGFTPIIFVGGVIATQELSKASHSSDHSSPRIVKRELHFTSVEEMWRMGYIE